MNKKLKDATNKILKPLGLNAKKVVTTKQKDLFTSLDVLVEVTGIKDGVTFPMNFSFFPGENVVNMATSIRKAAVVDALRKHDMDLPIKYEIL